MTLNKYIIKKLFMMYLMILAPFASLKKQAETLFRLKKQVEKYGL